MAQPICGIYKITNLINGKFYIGSSINLMRRKAEHKYRRKNFVHINNILKNAVKKYGEENLKFEIIEELLFGNWATKDYKLEMITSREQYFVDLMKPSYNIRKEVTTNKGCVSEATLKHIEKLRSINTGRTDAKFLAKEVIAYNNNEIINVYKSAKEASIKHNVDISLVYRSCSGERKGVKNSAKKIKFKYKQYESM